MKKQHIKKTIRSMFILLLMICLLTGCKTSEKKLAEESKEPVKISIILTVDPSTGTKNEQKVVEAFNKKYKGTYELDVDWIVETEADYRQNLKRLNATDELPDIITDLRMLPSFYQKMIAENRIADLTPYIDADEEWSSMIEPVVQEGCTYADGNIYLAPISTAAFSCCGIFWNQELFNKAGIDSFPTTWDEFWACCDKLTNAGITPLALHTDGTGWAPMLLASAAVASSSEEGAEFMSLIYPDTYQNASGLELANTLKRLFSYTTSNAMYNDFDTAYNNFFTGKAAMIPNGYWMIDQIPDGWEQYVRFSSFPGNALVSSPETFGWSLTSGYSEEVEEGALAFFKFRTEFNLLEKETMLSMEEKYISQVERDYRNAFLNSPKFVPNYQVKWNSVFQENTLPKYLPQLAEGRITPEDFLNYADDSIRQFEEEQ